MDRKNAPSTMLDFVDRLPLGALLRMDDRVFPNKKFEDLTGFSTEEMTTLEKSMQRLFPDRWQEMLNLYEMDRRTGFRQNRIVSIHNKKGNECWVEWMSLDHHDEEILLFQDVTHLWNTRIELTDRNRQLEKQLYERTENLEKTVNLLLSNHHQVREVQETNRLMAQLLEVNQRLLELLHSRLQNEQAEYFSILEKSAASLHHLRKCCLGKEQDDTLREDLQMMEDLLQEAQKQENRGM